MGGGSNSFLLSSCGGQGKRREGGKGLALLLPSCRMGLEIRRGPHLCRWGDQHGAGLSKLHKQSRGGLRSGRWGSSPGTAGTSRKQAWEPLRAGSPSLEQDTRPVLSLHLPTAVPFRAGHRERTGVTDCLVWACAA